jgi:hypothetical protein
MGWVGQEREVDEPQISPLGLDESSVEMTQKSTVGLGMTRVSQ